MRVNGKKIYLMVKESIIMIIMIKFMKANSQKDLLKVMELNIILKEEKNMKDNGKIIYHKVKEKYFMKMEIYIVRVIFQMENYQEIVLI